MTEQMDISRRVADIQEEVISIRRHIHQYPELSGCELATSALIARELKALGIEVQAREGTPGVVGLLAGNAPGKTIAVRADIDALKLQENTGLAFSSRHSGVSHSCGHDIHTAVLLGCAKVLSGMRNEFPGNVKFIFQPAEESLGGAQPMIEAGVLENPRVDAILALHCWPELPAGTVGFKRGSFMASSDNVEITITGRAGHAAHPHKSIDPVVIAGQVLTAMQTIVSREVSPVDSAVITIGKINGGTAPNIIAAEVEMAGTVRTVTPELRERMPGIIERLVCKMAESLNGGAAVKYLRGTPPLVNDNTVLDAVMQSAVCALGEDKVIGLDSVSMGGEDFAFYLEKVPGAMFRLGTANDNPDSRLALHNPKLIFDEQAIVTGIAVMCEATVRYLRQSN